MRKLKEILGEMNKLTDEMKEIVENEENSGKIQLSELNPGDVIVGESETKYVVLEHFPEGQTLIISKNFMLENVMFDGNEPNFNKSNILDEITEKCSPVIERDFGIGNIVPYYANLTTLDNQSRYENIIHLLRLLSFDEVRKYNDLLVNEELDDYWWTLTPWSTKERGWKYSLVVVSPRGDISHNDCSSSNGVRPSLYLTSNIFVSKGE